MAAGAVELLAGSDAGAGSISWWRTSIGQEEIQKITEAVAMRYLSQGPVTEEFEKRVSSLLGVPFAVAAPSASMALAMALMAVGIEPGDEVIVPNRSFIATAHAVLLLGAKVVLVDCEPLLPLVDAGQIKKKITSRTKAIMPVHLSGRSVRMNEINRIAKEHDLYVIEDAAQAFLSRNLDGFLGTFSDAGCYSFGPAKLLTTAQGGMIVTRNQEIYEKLRLLRCHGVKDTFEASYNEFGFNFKFNDILASIGLAQLCKVGQKIVRLREIYALYESALAHLEGVKLIPVDISAGEVPLYMEALCPQRDRLREFLVAKGIEIRPFLADLDTSRHLQNQGSFPNSRRFSSQGLILPSGPDQSLENVHRVIGALREYAVAL